MSPRKFWIGGFLSFLSVLFVLSMMEIARADDPLEVKQEFNAAPVVNPTPVIPPGAEVCNNCPAGYRYSANGEYYGFAPIRNTRARWQSRGGVFGGFFRNGGFFRRGGVFRRGC